MDYLVYKVVKLTGDDICNDYMDVDFNNNAVSFEDFGIDIYYKKPLELFVLRMYDKFDSVSPLKGHTLTIGMYFIVRKPISKDELRFTLFLDGVSMTYLFIDRYNDQNDEFEGLYNDNYSIDYYIGELIVTVFGYNMGLDMDYLYETNKFVTGNESVRPKLYRYEGNYIDDEFFLVDDANYSDI